MTLQKSDSNMVYVVSIAKGNPKGWDLSWRGIVEEKNKYFHVIGLNGWPKEPPNYIAFRYDGKLQSIHHIETVEVVTNMSTVFKEAVNEECEPSFVYHLGPKITPSHTVTKGSVWANGRVWCMLDTLLTCSTISEARDLTKTRMDVSNR